jgi:hypothetical protein
LHATNFGSLWLMPLGVSKCRLYKSPSLPQSRGRLSKQKGLFQSCSYSCQAEEEGYWDVANSCQLFAAPRSGLICFSPRYRTAVVQCSEILFVPSDKMTRSRPELPEACSWHLPMLSAARGGDCAMSIHTSRVYARPLCDRSDRSA